jgi:LTXXQ motif family protein
MNRIGSRRDLAALGIGLLLAVTAASPFADAQTAPRPLPANPQAQDRTPSSQQDAEPQDRGDAQPDRRGDVQRDRRDGRFARGGNRLERRLDFLHSELRITQAQERLWDDFSNAVREEAQEARNRLDDFRNDRDRGRLGAIERLERRQQRVQNQEARVDHLLAALRPLYAALSDNQQRMADDLLFRPDRGRFASRFGRGFGRGFRDSDRGFRRRTGGFAMDGFGTDPFDWRFGPNPNDVGRGPYDSYR